MASHVENAIRMAELRRQRLFLDGKDGNLGAALFLLEWLEVWGARLLPPEGWERLEVEIEKYLELTKD